MVFDTIFEVNVIHSQIWWLVTYLAQQTRQGYYDLDISPG